ncbi:MAG: DUF2069 domain-containing protein [Burkholderiales bacterium]|nr:DUF2069 domain-containing protein [Burkholderiales bacterium]
MTAEQAARGWCIIATACLYALLLLCMAWELWLAPLRPGGSWLVLKVLPLLWIAPGITRGRVYTYRASTMLILAYFTEGVVRAWSDEGLSAKLAGAEIVLAVVFFSAAIARVRASRAVRSPRTAL